MPMASLDGGVPAEVANSRVATSGSSSAAWNASLKATHAPSGSSSTDGPGGTRDRGPARKRGHPLDHVADDVTRHPSVTRCRVVPRVVRDRLGALGELPRQFAVSVGRSGRGHSSVRTFHRVRDADHRRKSSPAARIGSVPSRMSTSVAERIAQLIHRAGPIPFDAFVDEALYGDGGFFTGDHGAGRAGTRLRHQPRDRTALRRPGGAGARRLLGRSRRRDPFFVVEAGAGTWSPGRRCARLAARCAPALRYVLVERSDARRAEQRDVLALEPVEDALGPLHEGADADSSVATGLGPVATSLPDLPAIPLSGVVLANELLDNLPFRVVERTARGWSEVRVGVAGGYLRGGPGAGVGRSRGRSRSCRRVERPHRGPRAGADRRTRVAPSVRVRPPARRARRRRLRRDRGGAGRAGRARVAAHVPRPRAGAFRHSSIPAIQDITADVARRVPDPHCEPRRPRSARVHAGGVAGATWASTIWWPPPRSGTTCCTAISRRCGTAAESPRRPRC